MVSKNTTIYYILLIITLFIFPAELVAIDTSRPGPEDGPTDIKIIFYVIDIDEIIDSKQSFTANVFFQAEWEDKRLAKGDAVTKYDLEDVWNPNLQIVNRQKTFKSFPDIVEVDPEGHVIYRQRVFGQFSQPFDLHNFPMDTQKLSFQIVSVGNSPKEVKLSTDIAGIAEKFSLPNWKILSWDFENFDQRFHEKLSLVEGLKFTITAKRYVQFYVFKFIIPLMLIVFMSWIVFWIDPTDYTAQISVSITSMLTLIAYQYLVSSSLPRLPYLTRLDILMVLSTALVFIALIEVTITSYLTKKDKIELARTMDRYCRYIFPGVFIIILLTPILKG